MAPFNGLTDIDMPKHLWQSSKQNPAHVKKSIAISPKRAFHKKSGNASMSRIGDVVIGRTL